ncbi:MAG: hypothetical protein JO107_08665 [Hyphomicrobiales bacterium]|nr:hypothetical protein [Hyphomicrobiales bacterium]
MERLSRALAALARADVLIATIWLNVAARRAAFLALAALVAALGVAMLNVAGYFWLEPRFGAFGAALAVACGDFVVAALLALAAALARPRRDLDLALELRDHAVEQLTSLAANPLDLAGEALLGPLTSVLIRTLRSATGRAKAEGGSDSPV